MFAVIFFLADAGFIAFAVFAIYCGIRNKKFKRFLTENADLLLNGGGAEFYGCRYSADTVLVRYRLCISIVVLTHTRDTSFFTYDEKWAMILSDIICLTAGWWGIPWGPVRLIRSVINNSSPETVTLREMFG